MKMIKNYDASPPRDQAERYSSLFSPSKAGTGLLQTLDLFSQHHGRGIKVPDIVKLSPCHKIPTVFK